MKKLKFLLNVFLFAIVCNMQTGYSQLISISPQKLNVFYIGVDNPVKIAVSGVNSDNLKVKIDNGVITGEKGIYNVRIDKIFRTAKIEVYEDKAGKAKLLGTEEFRIKTIPDPVAFILNKKGGWVTKKELLAVDTVKCGMENFLLSDINFTITEFTMSTLIDQDYISKRTTGSKLNYEMKKIIENATKGQKIYIEDIKAKGPDGSLRNLSSINLVVIEE